MKERKCPECGKAFAPRYGSQVCCGDECMAARKKRLNRLNNEIRRDTVENSSWQKTLRARREKARRRREFFAARDAAFERAGLPVPKIETRQDRIVESRGRIPGGTRVAFVKF